MHPFNESIVDELIELEKYGVQIPTEAFEMAMEVTEDEYDNMKISDLVDLILALTSITA
jgi:hypothetical protein